MTTPDPVLEEQRAEARKLGLFIAGVSLLFFVSVAVAMGWRVYAMNERKQQLLQQEAEERAAAQERDRAAWKAEQARQARAAQVESQTR